VPLAMVMPSSFIRVLTLGDLDAVVAYLRNHTGDPQRGAAAGLQDRNAVAARPGRREADDRRRLEEPGEAGLLSRLARHCMACHSRVSEDVPADFKNAWGKGGRVFKGPFGESTRRQHLGGTRRRVSAAGPMSRSSWALTEGTSRDGRRLKPPMIATSAITKPGRTARSTL